MTAPQLDNLHLVARVQISEFLPALKQAIWCSQGQSKKGLLPQHIKLVVQPARIVGSSSSIWLYGYTLHEKAVQVGLKAQSVTKECFDLLPLAEMKALVPNLVGHQGAELTLHRQEGEGGQYWWHFQFNGLAWPVAAIRGGSNMQAMFNGFTAFPRVELDFRTDPIVGNFEYLQFNYDLAREYFPLKKWYLRANRSPYISTPGVKMIDKPSPDTGFDFCIDAKSLKKIIAVLGRGQVTMYVMPNQVVLASHAAPQYIFSLANLQQKAGAQ